MERTSALVRRWRRGRAQQTWRPSHSSARARARPPSRRAERERRENASCGFLSLLQMWKRPVFDCTSAYGGAKTLQRQKKQDGPRRGLERLAWAASRLTRRACNKRRVGRSHLVSPSAACSLLPPLARLRNGRRHSRLSLRCDFRQEAQEVVRWHARCGRGRRRREAAHRATERR